MQGITLLNRIQVFEYPLYKNNSSCQNIAMQDLCNESAKDRVFTQKVTVLKNGENLIDLEKIQINLRKEFQTSELNCLIVVDLLSSQDKPKFVSKLQNIKISFQTPVKNVFKLPKQMKINEYLQGLDLKAFVNSQNEDLYNSSQEQRQYGSWSIRLFPFHKSIHQFTVQLPQLIVLLGEQDIFSYQKSQRICNYKYIFAFAGYEQEVIQKLETQIYLNWGNTQVQFVIYDQQTKSQFSKCLEKLDLIVIPGGIKYRWKNRSKSVGMMLTWSILPKKGLPAIIKNLEKPSIKAIIPYSLPQILIDYSFHQFALIQNQNEQFMYTLANSINRLFLPELLTLQNELKVQQNQLENVALDKKIDQCQICGQFIVNYLGLYKNLTHCLKCVKKQFHIDKVLQKMPKQTFVKGCQLLTTIKSFKDQKEIQNQNVSKLMKNAVFFEYENICDGDFLGSFNNIHCKINETKNQKPRNPKQKIVRNTIDYLKKLLCISTASNIFDKYSGRSYTNDTQKQLFRKILFRTSTFIRKQEKNKLIQKMLPSYQEDNLKFLAIQLCVKDRT